MEAPLCVYMLPYMRGNLREVMGFHYMQICASILTFPTFLLLPWGFPSASKEALWGVPNMGSFWVMRPLACVLGRAGWHCGSTGTELCQERQCQKPATLLLRTSQAIRLLQQ